MDEIQSSTLEETVASGVTLIDFWAEWCGPCRMFIPILEELEKDMGGKVAFYKMNADQNMDTMQKFNIRQVPTIMIFKDGEMVEIIGGINTKEFFSEKLIALL